MQSKQLLFKTIKTKKIWMEVHIYSVKAKSQAGNIWGETTSLALVSHPSSDAVTIKMPYGVDILYILTSFTSIFS